MNKSRVASLSLIAYAGIFVMSAADAPRDGAAAASKEAAKQAERTVKALGRRDTQVAIASAEAAVAQAPAEAGYRLLLGQSYMQAGRFVSASQAFGDTLTLDGSSGKAALNLALTQIATGDWQAAQRTLASHSAEIPAADRGLAMALAGNTQGAVALLTDVARSPAATPKVRQNLALAYALAGQWREARVVASADMSPADVDARMQEWAAFAQPDAASDQVASLLGVRPVADRGQPTALALNNVRSPIGLARVDKPVEAPVAIAQTVVTPAPTRVAFAAPREVVQSLPVPTIASPRGPVRVAVAVPARVPRSVSTRIAVAHRTVAHTAPSRGQWYVQLGAYQSAGIARDDWSRARKRYAAFGDHTPQGTTIKVGTASYYRLSVGGFARADADKACGVYRARGGKCFVRMGAGEQVAAWAKPKSTQLAMR